MTASECFACKGTGSRFFVRDVGDGKLEFLDFQSKNPVGLEWVRVPCFVCKGTGTSVKDMANAT